MKKFLTHIVIGLAMVAGFTALQTVPAYAVDPTAAARQQACEGLKGTTGACSTTTASKSLDKIVTTILKILSLIAGVLAVIMIIFSGLKYITSGGDAQAVAGAKRALIYAIIGLVVVAFSQLIVRFVLNRA